jgi:hypothetical protein
VINFVAGAVCKSVPDLITLRLPSVSCVAPRSLGVVAKTAATAMQHETNRTRTVDGWVTFVASFPFRRRHRSDAWLVWDLLPIQFERQSLAHTKRCGVVRWYNPIVNATAVSHKQYCIVNQNKVDYILVYCHLLILDTDGCNPKSAKNFKYFSK